MKEGDPGAPPSQEPIEPDIGVNGWNLLWALVLLVMFFYHWGGALVFVAQFVLKDTPYALVEARSTAPAPIHPEDVVVVSRRVGEWTPGQILWIGDGESDSRLAKLLVVADSALVVEGTAAGDTLAELLPRDRVLGRAVQVILPLHHVRDLP